MKKIISSLALVLVLGAYAAHDATDPEYGSIYKQATRDRIKGNEFWSTRRQKDCVVGSGIEVCQPKAAESPAGSQGGGP